MSKVQQNNVLIIHVWLGFALLRSLIGPVTKQLDILLSQPANHDLHICPALAVPVTLNCFKF